MVSVVLVWVTWSAKCRSMDHPPIVSSRSRSVAKAAMGLQHSQGHLWAAEASEGSSCAQGAECAPRHSQLGYGRSLCCSRECSAREVSLPLAPFARAVVHSRSGAPGFPLVTLASERPVQPSHSASR